MLSQRRPRRWTGRLALVAAAVTTVAFANIVLTSASLAGSYAEDVLTPLSGNPAMVGGYPLVVIAAFAGLALSLLAIVPASLVDTGRSMRDPIPATEPGPAPDSEAPTNVLTTTPNGSQATAANGPTP